MIRYKRKNLVTRTVLYTELQQFLEGRFTYRRIETVVREKVQKLSDSSVIGVHLFYAKLNVDLEEELKLTGEEELHKSLESPIRSFTQTRLPKRRLPLHLTDGLETETEQIPVELLTIAQNPTSTGFTMCVSIQTTLCAITLRRARLCSTWEVIEGPNSKKKTQVSEE
ncbi:hypothetical protein K439DRAFT_1616284 [Ramaria rubella]|nr:hypothetical protein K439DRAFT_1616284 [Ramaria rubella]